MTNADRIEEDSQYIADCVEALKNARTNEENEQALIALFDSVGLHPRTFEDCMILTNDRGIRIDGLCLAIQTRY
jgi:hypothetical protein